jgi:hypothetical protein
MDDWSAFRSSPQIAAVLKAWARQDFLKAAILSTRGCHALAAFDILY